jgi:hypothetical protein
MTPAGISTGRNLNSPVIHPETVKIRQTAYGALKKQVNHSKVPERFFTALARGFF